MFLDFSKSSVDNALKLLPPPMEFAKGNVPEETVHERVHSVG